MPAAPSALSQFSPAFSLHTPEDQFVARYWPQIVYVAIAIAAIGCLIWGLSAPSPAAHTTASSAVTAQIWSHPQLAPSGRSLTVYEPSRSESDYRMEFSWVPDSGGVGWVFRSRDANNYYAAHLALEQHAAGAVVVVEHFSVIAGVESPHTRKVIPVPINAGLLRVHMDAIGSGFKLFVENNLADSWTDARLNSGALGFYNDGVHNPKLLALSVTFIENAVSRTSAVPLP
jgi:hypothetical protein